jgi:phage shock protein A
MEKGKANESVDAIAAELVLLDETLAKLSDDTAQLQVKIKDAKTRQNAIIMRGKAAQTRLGVRRQLHDANIDDAMQRFELYERKMDDLEGQIEAYDMGQKTLADEITDLEGSEEIDEELRQLKARVTGTPAAPDSPSAPAAPGTGADEQQQ